MDEVKRPFLGLRLYHASRAIIFACGVLSLFTILGFLGKYFWMLDLFSHFRVQYFVLLTISIIILIFTRYRKSAMIIALFAAVNLATIVPLFISAQEKPENSGRMIRAISFNVNSTLGNPEKVKRIIEECNPDMILLMEITSKWVEELKLSDMGYPHSCVQPRGDNFGIGLFSKMPLKDGGIKKIGRINLPSIVATIDTGEDELTVVVTHPVPPIDKRYCDFRDDQLDSIQKFIPENSPVILFGDLNTTCWSSPFKKLLSSTGLVDSARGWGIQSTWPTQMPWILIPIDHCLHSEDIYIENRELGRSGNSDHYSLIVDFVISDSGKTQD